MTKKLGKLFLTTILLFQTQSVFAAEVDAEKKTYSLDFDTTSFETQTISADGQTITFRAYTGVVYVQHPVDTDYQQLNIFIPVQYYQNKSINGYTSETAPMFFANTVGGYMPGAPETPSEGRGPASGGMNSLFHGLAHGYVVVSPGARGRTNTDETGSYTGKAPACIVDLKAAVRYLRYNDKTIPGDAEKIISNGTSAGGALSALLAATGNSRDYEPYLTELGAADVRDDVYGASCYCPITNLDHADMAYEWLFDGHNDYLTMVIRQMADFHMERKEVPGTLTDQQINVSERLKSQFPAYLNPIQLKSEDGSLLALDENGEGSFKEYVKSLVISSAQKALEKGTDLTEISWLTIEDNKVTGIDFPQYLSSIKRMKTPPAFDALGLTSGENELFGNQDVNARHFTAFGLENSTAGGTIAESSVIKLMNPMGYIGSDSVTTSPYWRIRHGTKDRDTSLAIPTILATTLKNEGYEVDFALPWNVPHSGDYDLDELFSWIDGISR